MLTGGSLPSLSAALAPATGASHSGEAQNTRDADRAELYELFLVARGML